MHCMITSMGHIHHGILQMGWWHDINISDIFTGTKRLMTQASWIDCAIFLPTEMYRSFSSPSKIIYQKWICLFIDILSGIVILLGLYSSRIYSQSIFVDKFSITMFKSCMQSYILKLEGIWVVTEKFLLKGSSRWDSLTFISEVLSSRGMIQMAK